MAVRRFFLEEAFVPGEAVHIDATQAHYARDVLRIGVGDSVQVFNGDGREYRATVAALQRRGMELAVEEELAVVAESPLVVEIGVGLARGERMDWTLQKATELGVARITPLTLERCNAKFDRERADNRARHWQQVVASACEQCGRARLPTVDLPQELGAWLAEPGDALRLVMHTAVADPLAAPVARPQRVRVLIGPEGGLAPLEVERAVAAGFQPWSLGPRVLRTETAPVAALAIVQYLWGDCGAMRS